MDIDHFFNCPLGASLPEQLHEDEDDAILGHDFNLNTAIFDLTPTHGLNDAASEFSLSEPFPNLDDLLLETASYSGPLEADSEVTNDQAAVDNEARNDVNPSADFDATEVRDKEISGISIRVRLPRWAESPKNDEYSSSSDSDSDGSSSTSTSESDRDSSSSEKDEPPTGRVLRFKATRSGHRPAIPVKTLRRSARLRDDALRPLRGRTSDRPHRRPRRRRALTPQELRDERWLKNLEYRARKWVEKHPRTYDLRPRCR